MARKLSKSLMDVERFALWRGEVALRMYGDDHRVKKLIEGRLQLLGEAFAESDKIGA